MSTVRTNEHTDVQSQVSGPQGRCKARVLCAAVAAALLGMAGSAQAVQWGTPGDGASGYADVTLSYSSMWRVEDRDYSSNQLKKEINLDDGNRNFAGGSQVSNMFKVLAEFGLRNDTPSTSWGVFTRAYALWDTAIWNSRSDHDAPARNNNGAVYQGSLSPYNDGFTPQAQDRIGQRVELLDAFVYVDAFQDTDHPVSVKLGRQVVNWGESLFIQNGILNALNPADVTRAAIPGTEIKEILYPVNQLFGSVALSPTVSLSAYYQFDFQRTIAPPPGTFFSSNDFIGDGAEKVLLDVFAGALPIPNPGGLPEISTLDRLPDLRPSNSGQFGVALNWTAEDLNYTDFGFYYLNYHSKLPQLGFASSLDGIADSPFFTPELREMLGNMMGIPSQVPIAPWVADTSFFFHEYFEDVNLFGASFNTVLPSFGIFDMSMSGEMAYHTEAPVQTIKADEAIKSMMTFLPDKPPLMFPGQEVHLATREELFTAQVTINSKIALPSLVDDITLLAEVGMVSAPGQKKDEVFRGPFEADNFAWGYKMKMINTWFSALDGISPSLSGTDLVGTIAWSHDVDGISPIPAGSFTSGMRALGLSLEAVWQSTFSVGLFYNVYWWDDNEELGLGDRDNAGIILKAFF